MNRKPKSVSQFSPTKIGFAASASSQGGGGSHDLKGHFIRQLARCFAQRDHLKGDADSFWMDRDR